MLVSVLILRFYIVALVPSTDTSWSLRFASTFCIPLSLSNAPEISLTQLSQVMGTAKRVYVDSVYNSTWLRFIGELYLERRCDGHFIKLLTTYGILLKCQISCRNWILSWLVRGNYDGRVLWNPVDNSGEVRQNCQSEILAPKVTLIGTSFKTAATTPY